MPSWRNSGWVRAAVRVPLLRDLPLGILEPVFQRVERAYYLFLEYVERSGAWIRTARELGIGCLLQPELLTLFFHPESILGTRASPRARQGPLLPHAPAAGPFQAGVSPLRAIVYSSSKGNFFHSEMAELIALGLEQSGRFGVQRQDERSEPGDADLHIVVAPHEFFFLGRGARFAAFEYAGFRKRCSLFLAEQPGTKHFATCLPFAAEAERVLDLNASSTSLLQRLGFRAQFFPVGFVDAPDLFAKQQPLPEPDAVKGLSFASAQAATMDSRPIDLLFTGVLTRRRAAFFSRHAAFFAQRCCFLSLPASHVPLQPGVASALGTAEATALSQRAKILLNVHRDERAYFEWHRVVIRGFWQRVLVVSEPSELPPAMVAGTHLIVASLEEMPETIRWLLDTPEGQRKAEQVRDAAYRLLCEEYDLRRWANELADAHGD